MMRVINSIKVLWTVIITFMAIVMSAQEFYFGVDLSYVNEMEDCGADYNVSGAPTDPYEIFSDNGANIVRLRLWHTPSWYDELNDGNRYSDFNDVRHSIMRAKGEGMQVLLDFHLSDNWADPSKQVAPAAWNAVLDNLPVLQDSLYNYIYSTLNRLASENLLPEMVQIGNETNRGILLSQEVNDAGWSLDWDRNSALFNSAITAVRDIEETYQASIQIALHIADPSAVPWYIEQFVEHGVIDFDIIGISYYWQWHDDTFEQVGGVISSLKNTYPGKEVMLLETAYPWTTNNADGANNILSATYPGYTPFSASNQKQWMIDLTQEVIDQGGKGVFYWEPAWVSTGCSSQWAEGSSWDNATFFNASHALIENGGIEWMSHPYDFISTTSDGISTGSDLEIYQAGNEIWIHRGNEYLANGMLRIEYYSMEGRKIYGKFFQPLWKTNLMQVSLPDLPQGSYFISLTEAKTLLAGKVIFLK